ARVTDAVTGTRPVCPGGLDEVLQVADGADVVEPAVLAKRDAGGVVAAILESAQAVQEERLRLSRSDVSDDSTHVRRNTTSSAMRRPRSVAGGQPSSWVTSDATLAHRSCASSSLAASARMRTTGSVPDGRTSTRPRPSSSALTA